MEQPKKKYEAEGAYRLLQTLHSQTALSEEEKNGESALNCMRKSHSLIDAFQKEEVQDKPEKEVKETSEAIDHGDEASVAAEAIREEWKRIEGEVLAGLIVLDKKITFVRKLIWKLAKWQNKRSLKRLQTLMKKAEKRVQRRKENETGD